jgi:hypothetical protein
MEVWVTRYNFESWPFKDHSCHVCFKLAYWFQRLLNIFSIGSYVKTKSSHGGHLGYAISTKITNLVEDHPVIISIMLQFHRLSSFWQEDFQSFNQSEHIIGPGSHVGFPICTKITNLVEDPPMNISAKFGPNLFNGFREEDENMKSLQMRTTMTTDAKWWQKLIWPFGPGELKSYILIGVKKNVGTNRKCFKITHE